MSNINAQSIINEVMAAHAIAPDDGTEYITFKTSERGTHRIINDKAHLQRFADAVRKNAALFGGGLIREAKTAPAVSYASKTISLYKQLIEDQDWHAALQLADEKLSPLFFFGTHGKAYMQVAPIPCDFEPRFVSTLSEDGRWAVIEPVSMLAFSGDSVRNKRSRDAQVEHVMQRYSRGTDEQKEAMFSKAYAKPMDKSAARAKWMADHGIIDDAAIEERIEQQAAQDVAEVVAQAVAVSAIAEAMAPEAETESTPEIVTCEAGESEAQSASTGKTVDYVVHPSYMLALGLAPACGYTATPTPAVSSEPPDPRPVESTNFAADIPLSLAVSAFGGVSMSPERRGASAQAEYAQSMKQDYDELRKQAEKGGTLDLLEDVFSKYNARQSAAYRAYLASSSRCISSFITGPSNFPVARANKRNDIAHKRLNDYLDGGQVAFRAAVRTLRPDLRAIMSGDADAIDRLTIELAKLERGHESMKAANKAIRDHAKDGEARQVDALMELGFSESKAIELLHPMRGYSQGFQSFTLTNNQANIRRIRARLAQITAAKARPVEKMECSNGITFEDDAPANRVRLYFPGKPDDATRSELKSRGFRWSPTLGAWQAYRNYQTITTAKRMAGEPTASAQNEAQEVTEVAPIEDTSPVVESAEITAPAPEPVPVVEIEATTPAMESTDALPEGWTESAPGRMATSEDPATGGIVDTTILTGKWFAISNATSKQVPGEFSTRAEAIAALDRANTPAAESQPEPVAPVVGTSTEWAPAIGEKYIGAVECAVAMANMRGDGMEYRVGQNAIMERRIKPIALQTTKTDDTAKFNIRAKSGAWFACVYMIGTVYGLRFEAKGMEPITGEFATHKQRMQALEMMANALKTPPDGGMPIKQIEAHTSPVAECTPDTQPAVSRVKPEHDLKVGDVVRSSWGYDQTNVNHYQITKLIGKRTVEVRELVEHKESTGDMTGHVAPVWGEFIGEPMRRTVDRHGHVNILREKFGRASKIEPVAVVHGVRCYASTGYSSYA